MKPARTRVLELRSVRGTGGGPEKTILLGAAQRDWERFDVTVCYVRDLRDEVFDIHERAAQLGVDYVEVHERMSFDARIVSSLSRLAIERGTSIVHSHDYKTDLLALLLARRLGVVPLSTAHGWTGETAKERYLYYPGGKWLLRWFPRVIAVSSDIKAELVRRGVSPDRITVVLNGIDPDTFRRGSPEVCERIRRELGIEKRHVVIGAVGRLEQQKRFDLLIDAFAAEAARRPDWRLVIVGDGSLRAELDSLARARRIEDRCHLVGHRPDVRTLHNAFDLFVQSSDYEGTPNAVLEAMAMETPIVATDVGGTSELAAADSHALLVTSGDTNALRQAMVTAIENPRGARIRAVAARRRTEQELSFEKRTRTLESIYDQLVRVSSRSVAMASA